MVRIEIKLASRRWKYKKIKNHIKKYILRASRTYLEILRHHLWIFLLATRTIKFILKVEHPLLIFFMSRVWPGPRQLTSFLKWLHLSSFTPPRSLGVAAAERETQGPHPTP